MRVTIRERRVLSGLQSASALEQVGDVFYVVGDDSPMLYRLDARGNVVGTTRLIDSHTNDGERLAKIAKPDLEAMSTVEWQGRRELLCFGSGSKSPARDVCFRVDVTEGDAPRNVRRVELTALYDALRGNSEIVGTQMLNIEAACSTNKRLFLFQRGNISGRNTRIEFDLGTFMEFLDAPQAPVPTLRVTSYLLPTLQERRAGFSAATEFGDAVWIAAAVEDTDNEIDDGAKLASFVGTIQGQELVWIEPVLMDDEIAPVKIEGISVLSSGEDFIDLVAVTDDDEGASEMLWVEVR